MEGTLQRSIEGETLPPSRYSSDMTAVSNAITSKALQPGSSQTLPRVHSRPPKGQLAMFSAFVSLVIIFVINACFASLYSQRLVTLDKRGRNINLRLLAAGRGDSGGQLGHSSCAQLSFRSEDDSSWSRQSVGQQHSGDSLENMLASPLPLLSAEDLSILPQSISESFMLDSDDDIEDETVELYVLHNQNAATLLPLPHLTQHDLDVYVPSSGEDITLGSDTEIDDSVVTYVMQSEGIDTSDASSDFSGRAAGIPQSRTLSSGWERTVRALLRRKRPLSTSESETSDDSPKLSTSLAIPYQEKMSGSPRLGMTSPSTHSSSDEASISASEPGVAGGRGQLSPADQHLYGAYGEGSRLSSLQQFMLLSEETILPVENVFCSPTAHGMSSSLRLLWESISSPVESFDDIFRVKYTLQRLLKRCVPAKDLVEVTDVRTWASILGRSVRALEAVWRLRILFPRWKLEGIWQRLIEELPLQVGPNFSTEGSHRCMDYIRAASAVLRAYKGNKKPTKALLDIAMRPGELNDRTLYVSSLNWNSIRSQLTEDDLDVINSFKNYPPI